MTWASEKTPCGFEGSKKKKKSKILVIFLRGIFDIQKIFGGKIILNLVILR